MLKKRFRQSLHARAGFTIVELLVVVVIIGILSALAMPQYQKMLERSRIAEGLQILGALRKAQEVYYAQYATYATIGFTNWNDVGNLLVDIPLAKYFDYGSRNRWIVPLAVAWVKRNNTDNPGYRNYCLMMDTDGKVWCREMGFDASCNGAAGTCANFGYARFNPRQ